MSWGILVSGGQVCRGLRKPDGGWKSAQKTGDQKGEGVLMSSERLPWRHILRGAGRPG